MVERAITGPVNNPGRGLRSPPDFTSAEQTVTVDTQLDVAHSLGAIPTLFEIILRCTTANTGYGVGDEVLYPGHTGIINDRGAAAFADATNVSIVHGDGVPIINASTFNAADITTTSWRWVVRAWR